MQEQDGDAPPTRRRGRPRDPTADGRILDAARAVAGELGVHGASMSAIADRSGVGKPTIYLRWSNRRAVIMAAITEIADAPGEPAGESLADELTGALEDDRRALVAGPHAAFLRAVLFESARDPEIARVLDEAVLGPRRQRIVGILERHAAAGRLRSDIDPAAVADLLVARLIEGMVLGVARADARAIAATAALVVAGATAYAEASGAG